MINKIITALLLVPLTLSLSSLVYGSDYERSKFASAWSTKDKGVIATKVNKELHSCSLNTRSQLLSKNALTMRIGSNKVCIPLTGRWLDYYTSEEIADANIIGVDHVVSLKDAWISGAKDWTKEQRNEFYNDTKNLVLTNQMLNIAKSDKSPSKWEVKFKNRKIECKYIEKYNLIKQIYNLSYDSEEIDYMKEQDSQGGCLIPMIKDGMFGLSVSDSIIVR